MPRLPIDVLLFGVRKDGSLMLYQLDSDRGLVKLWRRIAPGVRAQSAQGTIFRRAKRPRKHRAAGSCAYYPKLGFGGRLLLENERKSAEVGAVIAVF